MTDYHTHILPGMDDGAKNSRESAGMISRLARLGVRQAALTSHFRFGRQELRDFLQKRREAMEQIRPFLEREGVTGLLGAEVTMTPRMTQRDGLEALCLEGGAFLLVEFSFLKWEEYYFDELEQMKACLGITPVIAHVERYRFMTVSLAKELTAMGCVLQLNCADAQGERRFLKKLGREGLPVVWGSDCHNLTSRPPVFLTEEEIDKLGLTGSTRAGRDLLLLSNGKL